MSALRGEGERGVGMSFALLARAFAAGERAAPGVRAGRAAQVLRQGGEGRDRRRSPVLAKGEMAAPLLRRASGGAETLRAPGDQDEIGRGGRRRDQAAALIVDPQPAIETLAHLDAAAGVGAPMRATGDLDQPGAEAHGVIASHAARVATAQAVGEIARRAAPRGRGARPGAGSGDGCGRRGMWAGRPRPPRRFEGRGGGARPRGGLARVAQRRSTRPLACGEWAAM